MVMGAQHRARGVRYTSTSHAHISVRAHRGFHVTRLPACVILLS
jgi:hypothetical protein